MNTSRPDRDPDPDAWTHDLLTRSRLFREYVAEREEILRHKWFESQKAGHDIGFESALILVLYMAGIGGLVFID